MGRKRSIIESIPNGLKIVLFLLFAIIAGGILLALPVSQQNGVNASTWDHFYTALSLVSVNSMTTIPFSSSYNLFGKTIAIVLMLVAGVGIMSFFGIVALMTKKQLGYSEKELILTDLDEFHIRNMKE